MQTDYAILYLEINIVSLVTIGIILQRTTGLSKMVAQRNFAMSIIAEMIFIVSDTLFVLVNEGVLNLGASILAQSFVKFWCKEVYFFSTGLLCFLWFLYFELLRETDFAKKKINIGRSLLLLVTLMVLLVVNIFSKILFYVDKDGVYHRGPLFLSTYVLSYIYIAVACVRIIIHIFDKSKPGNRANLWVLALFPLAPGAAGLLQFVYPRLPVACAVLAITTLVLYLNWIDQLISLDPLTGLNNRKQLIHYYEHWARNNNDGDIINVLMIDANKFKSINDNFGHIQGDNALKNIAKALKVACKNLPKRPNIARYGGDEFAVLFESNDENSAELLKESIAEELKKENERTKIPFELTVSIGIASSDGSLTLKELIDKADEEMYKEKTAGR